VIEVHFLLDKISKLNIGWNERALGEDDAFELARRLGVDVQMKSMSTDGFYFRLLGREFIAINRDLPQPQRLKVLFHELAHLLFHAPTSGPALGFHRIGKRTRQEIEADSFAICALLPLTVFESNTAAELMDEGFDPTLLAERAEVWQRFCV
jgi:Zn-dependent peptidase ImmA (M78 family)